jgi:hypothetical protein
MGTECGREETVLPKMSAAGVVKVEVARVEEMGAAQAPGQGVGAVGDDHQA